MTLKPLKISNEMIRKFLEDMDVDSIDTNFYERFAKWLVGVGRIYLTQLFNLDSVNPETGEILTTQSTGQLLLSIIDGIEYSIQEEEISIRLNSAVNTRAVIEMEYGSTYRLPQPFYRKMLIYLQDKLKNLVAMFYYEEGVN